jgi:hypothetical protein
VWELTAGGLRHGGSCVREVLRAAGAACGGAACGRAGVCRVANVTQNAGALLASAGSLV